MKRANRSRRLLRLLRSDSGVATVEWVALAAGMVIGSVAVAYIIVDSLAITANKVGNQLTITN